MTDNTPGDGKGLLESLSGLAATLVSVAHTRLELLSVDLEEERVRLFSLVAMYLAAAFCLAVGSVLAIILTVFILWDDHRLLALFSVAGFFLLVGLLMLGFARHNAKTKPKLFLGSLMELAKDKQELDST